MNARPAERRGSGGRCEQARGGRAGGRRLKRWWFVLHDEERLVVSRGVHGDAEHCGEIIGARAERLLLASLCTEVYHGRGSSPSAHAVTMSPYA